MEQREMQKIPSFTVDHSRLMPGVYVSRVDNHLGAALTTFDLRMTRPNKEPVIGTGAIHAIEHLGATYLRNRDGWKERVVYFGPMGCRTGFYLILAAYGEDLAPEQILPLLKETFAFVKDFRGTEKDIPGASAKDCGNYKDMNLKEAKSYADRYLTLLKFITADRMRYPE